VNWIASWAEAYVCFSLGNEGRACGRSRTIGPFGHPNGRETSWAFGANLHRRYGPRGLCEHVNRLVGQCDPVQKHGDAVGPTNAAGTRIILQAAGYKRRAFSRKADKIRRLAGRPITLSPVWLRHVIGRSLLKSYGFPEPIASSETILIEARRFIADEPLPMLPHPHSQMGVNSNAIDAFLSAFHSSVSAF
jgi:hypothetical protein